MKPTSQLFPLATLVGGLLLGLAIGSLTAPSAAGGTQLADDRPEPASPTDDAAAARRRRRRGGVRRGRLL